MHHVIGKPAVRYIALDHPLCPNPEACAAVDASHARFVGVLRPDGVFDIGCGHTFSDEEEARHHFCDIIPEFHGPIAGNN